MSVKITIIVAIYKVEAYLRACIDSILAQTYQDFELLLIDDGSPDRCGEICDEYAGKDSRIRVIHQENQGISEVRNCGVREAKGEYLVFVDGDDFISPALVERVLSYQEKFNTDIVIYRYQAIDAQGRFLYTIPVDLPHDQVFNLEETPKILLSPPSMCNKLIKKELFQNLHFPAGVIFEDLWMASRLYLRTSRIVYTDTDPLYTYVVHDSSIMRNNNFDRLYENRVRVLRETIEYYREQGLFDQYKKELEALTLLHVFFYASLEILLVVKKHPYLMEFRKLVENYFPDFHKNPYIKDLSRKEQLKFWLLYRKQYRLIRILTSFKNLAYKVRG